MTDLCIAQKLSISLQAALVAVCLCGAPPAVAEPDSQGLPEAEVKSLMDRTVFTVAGKATTIRAGILSGRYMEEDVEGGCKEATLPGWGNFSLRQCTYRQPDKGAGDGHKTASVIMLNPGRQVLASWIIASCRIVMGGSVIDACVNKLAWAIIDASGSQFVVAGLVLEDMKNVGVQHAYAFRDGVTVSIEGAPSPGYTGSIDNSALAAALDPNRRVLATASIDAPARLQSTTRSMYRAYAGPSGQDVTGVKWLAVVRATYQDAWMRAHNSSLPNTIEKYRNDLMVARCYALMGVKPAL